MPTICVQLPKARFSSGFDAVARPVIFVPFFARPSRSMLHAPTLTQCLIQPINWPLPPLPALSVNRQTRRKNTLHKVYFSSPIHMSELPKHLTLSPFYVFYCQNDTLRVKMPSVILPILGYYLRKIIALRLCRTLKKAHSFSFYLRKVPFSIRTRHDKA
jgi:hypothetical protein